MLFPVSCQSKDMSLVYYSLTHGLTRNLTLRCGHLYFVRVSLFFLPVTIVSYVVHQIWSLDCIHMYWSEVQAVIPHFVSGPQPIQV